LTKVSGGKQFRETDDLGALTYGLFTPSNGVVDVGFHVFVHGHLYQGKREFVRGY
jgi:hypothetical protein